MFVKGVKSMYHVCQTVTDWINEKKRSGSLSCVIGWTRITSPEDCFPVKDPIAVQSVTVTEAAGFQVSTIISAVIDAFSSHSKLISCDIRSSSGEWISVSSDYDVWSSDDGVFLSR